MPQHEIRTTMKPFSITMMRSLSIMVFKRCAIVMTVQSLKLLLIVF